MSIDPRTLKQLLQLQMMEKVDLLSSGASSGTADSGVSFGNLLQSVLSQAAAPTETTGQAFEPMPVDRMPGTLARTAMHPALMKPSAYDPIISQAAAKYGVPQSLIKAVIQTESSFNPNAVSHAGAKGLMQLMDDTGAGLGVTDPFDPRQNIEGGTKFLAHLLDKYKGSESIALAAYNAGPNRVDRLGIATEADLEACFDRLPKETQRYIGKVLDLQRTYQV